MFLFLLKSFTGLTIFKIHKTMNFISLKEKVIMKNFNRKHIYYICNFARHIYLLPRADEKAYEKQTIIYEIRIFILSKSIGLFFFDESCQLRTLYLSSGNLIIFI